MRLLVTGSRDWDDWKIIETAIRHATAGITRTSVTVVHGDAPGADVIADHVAQQMSMHVEPHPADWTRLGRSAGPIRNVAMVRLGADVCLCFAASWASGSGATARMARKAGIPTVDHGVDTSPEAKP